MKNIHKVILMGVLLISFSACKKDWLERKPNNILFPDQAWNDPTVIKGILAGFYDRLPTDVGLVSLGTTSVDINQTGQAEWRNMADYDDAMWSGAAQDARNNMPTYDQNRWRLWNYGLIRDINLAIENIEALGTKLSAADKISFNAELRFIRAYNYFELVKRMGGVPLVTKQLIYDNSGNPSYLQQPRAKEFEVYDFIASELDAIKNKLTNVGSNTRANKYIALALKSRAMLYAASVAKYNNLNTPSLTTAGGEVGIPASMANAYYQKSLDASQEIINSGVYTLYKVNSGNLGENFYETITKKANNKEVIFAWDYLLAKDKRHTFSYDNIARGLREDNLSSSNVTPSLNLVENYDYLDGSNGVLKTRNTGNTDYIYYDKVSDIFANKDARLYGTVMYPGSTFKGLNVEMQAGVLKWNTATNAYITIESTNLGSNYATVDGGDGKLLTGANGPNRSIQEVSNTGFYLRKYIDAGAGTSTRGIRSDIWWVWFRLGEIYLNAAETAFELGQTTVAVNYINAIRERAGFGSNSYTVASLTLDKVRSEFRSELAFEDHRVWDLKRWRMADKVWNGVATNPDAKVYALYPYRIIKPGDAARDGKYVFIKMVAPRFGSARFFQLNAYYSPIAQSVLDNNPKIVKNPLQ
jgi:hypothetical protein